MHGNEHVVAIRAQHHGLVLHTLRYADEIAPAPRSPKKSTVAGRELAMAEQLVDSLAMAFDRAAFTDEYQARLTAAIARKAKGKTLELDEPEADDAGDGKVISIMEALERSLKKAKTPTRHTPRAAVEPRRKRA